MQVSPEEERQLEMTWVKLQQMEEKFSLCRTTLRGNLVSAAGDYEEIYSLL